MLFNSNGMENKEIRRENLRLLIEQYGTAAALADKTEIDVTYLRNIKNGERDMGVETARKLEEKTGKSPGWMDVLHYEDAAELMLADYRRASPQWQLILRFLARLSPTQQEKYTKSVNALLGIENVSDAHLINGKSSASDAEKSRKLKR